MTLAQAIELIQADCFKNKKTQKWVDLGCGSGLFTQALFDLLPAGSMVIRVDKEKIAAFPLILNFHHANFVTNTLPFSDLDGILMANSLHYVKDKVALIKNLRLLFRSSPRFIIVEYDTSSANAWVPYPIPFNKLQNLFPDLSIKMLNQRDSSYGGKMYSALISQ